MSGVEAKGITRLWSQEGQRIEFSWRERSPSKSAPIEALGVSSGPCVVNLLVPNQVVDLRTHCKIIRIHCSAIQTLLQLNSNNSNWCALRNYFAVAGGRRRWRDLRGLNAPKYRENSTDLCGVKLQCRGSGRL